MGCISQMNLKMAAPGAASTGLGAYYCGLLQLDYIKYNRAGCDHPSQAYTSLPIQDLFTALTNAIHGYHAVNQLHAMP